MLNKIYYCDHCDMKQSSVLVSEDFIEAYWNAEKGEYIDENGDSVPNGEQVFCGLCNEDITE